MTFKIVIESINQVTFDIETLTIGNSYNYQQQSVHSLEKKYQMCDTQIDGPFDISMARVENFNYHSRIRDFALDRKKNEVLSQTKVHQ